MERNQTIHTPIAAGVLYPSDPRDLAGKVDALMQAGKEIFRTAAQSTGFSEKENPRVLVVPHAAYDHVGSLIASAFAALVQSGGVGDIRRVILLSTLHRDKTGRAIIPSYTSFEIPGARLEVDSAVMEKLKRISSVFTVEEIPFAEEHAQEVLLPFILRMFPQAGIVPILLGNNSPGLARKTAESLLEVTDFSAPDTITIVSTNLSRFVNQETARAESEELVSAMKTAPDKVLKHISALGEKSACGTGAVLTAVRCFNQALRFHPLMIRSSGPVLPEHREVWYGSFCGYHESASQEEVI